MNTHCFLCHFYHQTHFSACPGIFSLLICLEAGTHLEASFSSFSVPFLVFPNPSSDGGTKSECSVGDVSVLSMCFSLLQSLVLMFSEPFPLSRLDFFTDL